MLTCTCAIHQQESLKKQFNDLNHQATCPLFISELKAIHTQSAHELSETAARLDDINSRIGRLHTGDEAKGQLNNIRLVLKGESIRLRHIASSIKNKLDDLEPEQRSKTVKATMK